MCVRKERVRERKTDRESACERKSKRDLAEERE